MSKWKQFNQFNSWQLPLKQFHSEAAAAPLSGRFEQKPASKGFHLWEMGAEAPSGALGRACVSCVYFRIRQYIIIYVFSSHNILSRKSELCGSNCFLQERWTCIEFPWFSLCVLHFLVCFSRPLPGSRRRCLAAQDMISLAKTSLYALNARRCLVWSTFKRVHQGPGMSFVGFQEATFETHVLM